MELEGTDDHSNKNQIDLDSSPQSHEVYMSIVWQGSQLGLCYYDVNDMQINVMSDTFETDDFFLIKQAVHQIHPLVVILSSVHDSRLLSCLKKIAKELNTIYSPSSSEPCRLEFLPNINFNYEVGKRRILGLNIPSVPQYFNDGERQLYFSSLISLKSTNMVRSVGGLLKYLEDARVGIELESNVDQVPILGFKTFIIESQIQMDCQTYCALKIFGMEQHPSVFKSDRNNGKEALSLFGKKWFLKPLKDAGKIKQRYNAISFLINPQNVETVSNLAGCLKHIKFLPKILLRMSKAQASIGDWIALYKTLYHTVGIKNICRMQPQHVEIFVKINSTFTDDLQKCMNVIKKTMDFDESKQNKRFVVLPNVYADLDEKKLFFKGLPDLMTRVAREEIKSLHNEIEHCSVSLLPEIGYLLVIDIPEGKSSQGDHTIEGLEFKFASTSQLYYKSAKTKEMDSLLGDTQSEILEMEFSIMHNVQFIILENTQVLLNVMALAAELDCLLALAKCAYEFGYVCPNLIEANTIEIRGGRHPLQELCCNPFVPNDTNLGGQHFKMKLITGPNACGKSVYLKQVALIVFMAHIGCFVPAEEASIGPVDGIFSCIKSTESVSVQMSTFMQDISQVSEALRSATSFSLIILDEFGKGTKSEDGLSLLTAVLKFWIARGESRPLTLVSTHFHGIIQQKLLPQGEIENLTFDTFYNNDELVFLYQLVPGHASSSFACNIAAQMGMSANLAKRGHQVFELLSQYKLIPVEEDESSRKQRKLHEKLVSSFLSMNLSHGDAKRHLTAEVSKLFLKKSQKLMKKTDDLTVPQRVIQMPDKSCPSIPYGPNVNEPPGISNQQGNYQGKKRAQGLPVDDHSNKELSSFSDISAEDDRYQRLSCLPSARKQRKSAEKDTVQTKTTGSMNVENDTTQLKTTGLKMVENGALTNLDKGQSQNTDELIERNQSDDLRGRKKQMASSPIPFPQSNINGDCSLKKYQASTNTTTGSVNLKRSRSVPHFPRKGVDAWDSSTSLGYAQDSLSTTTKIGDTSNSTTSSKAARLMSFEGRNVQGKNESKTKQHSLQSSVEHRGFLVKSPFLYASAKETEIQLTTPAKGLKKSVEISKVKHNSSQNVSIQESSIIDYYSCISSPALSNSAWTPHSRHSLSEQHTLKSSVISSHFSSVEEIAHSPASESEQS